MAENLRVAKKYRIDHYISSGSFGDIYQGTNLISGDKVAVKLESTSTRHPQLKYEAKVYRALAGGTGIPVVHWFGVEGEYNALVIDLLGPSLEDLFRFCGRKFSCKTILLLADQLISRIRYIHSKGYIHRDIKPENFLMGLKSRGKQLYAIDFGLAKRYRDPRTHMHIPYKENKTLSGTARYASVNTHLGAEQSRRDDMESLMYMLIYFNRGSLPWQGFKAPTKKQTYDLILQKKITTSCRDLTQYLPPEFEYLLHQFRSLKFEAEPCYDDFCRLMPQLFFRSGYKYDDIYDWTLIKYQNELYKRAVTEGVRPKVAWAASTNRVSQVAASYGISLQTKTEHETADKESAIRNANIQAALPETPLDSFGPMMITLRTNSKQIFRFVSAT